MAGKKGEPRAHAGGFWAHIKALSAALKGSDWQAAGGYAIELFQMVMKDLDDVPPEATGGVGATPAVDAASCAARLDEFVGEHQANFKGSGRRAPKGAGAFPFAELVPLLIQALLAILSRR